MSSPGSKTKIIPRVRLATLAHEATTNCNTRQGAREKLLEMLKRQDFDANIVDINGKKAVSLPASQTNYDNDHRTVYVIPEISNNDKRVEIFTRINNNLN